MKKILSVAMAVVFSLTVSAQTSTPVKSSGGTPKAEKAAQMKTAESVKKEEVQTKKNDDHAKTMVAHTKKASHTKKVEAKKN